MNTEADKMAENQKSLLSHNAEVVQLVEECIMWTSRRVCLINTVHSHSLVSDILRTCISSDVRYIL